MSIIQTPHIKPNILWRARIRRRRTARPQLPYNNHIHFRRLVLDPSPCPTHLALLAADVHAGPLKSWILLLALADEVFDVRPALPPQRRILLRDGDLSPSLADFARKLVLVQMHRAADCLGPVGVGAAGGHTAVEGPSFVVGLGGVWILVWDWVGVQARMSGLGKRLLNVQRQTGHAVDQMVRT